ncbi:DUF4333 domain-containing protein [Streptomyces olindensis]|uniref:DUF4333 domain-containing protein n=1 Tax=Streptomyces olindensis TaxID=358823 RepID=UPI0033FD0BF7
MKYVVVSLTAATAVALGGLAVAVPRLLSTESTSTVDATSTVSGTEVEKQVREHYALPLVQEKPRAVSCAGGLKAQQRATIDCTVTSKDGKKQNIAVAVTKVEGNEVSYDYVVLGD